MQRSQSDWQHELEAVNELMRIVSLQSDPQELIRIYAEGVRNLRGTDRLVALSRRGLDAPWYRVTRDSRQAEPLNPWRQRDKLPLFSEGFLGELLYEGRPRAILDLNVPESDPTHGYFEGMRALFALPHWEDGRVPNMSLRMYADPAEMDVEQFPNLLWQSNLIGRTTANLVLRRELSVAYDALDREMRSVGDIQRSLLPADLPTIPGLEIAASYQPATQAGGDYYDVFMLPDGEVGVFIADVSGHGTPAAVLMAVTHALAHSYPGPGMPPGAVLAHLNSMLGEHYALGSSSFVTAFYGVYNPTKRTLTYARAGHNPPRHQRNGSVASLDEVGSVPLGVLSGVTFDEATVRLEAGDTVLLYTDGATETTNTAGEPYGEERVDLMLASHSVDAAALIASVLAEVRNFSGGRPAEDDRTLVVMRLR